MADDGLSHDPVPYVRTVARFADGYGFEARVVEVDGAVAVAVAGEIDMATAGFFQQAIDRAGRGDGRVMIDLASTTFMDSSGLAVLIGAYDRLGRQQDAVVLRGAGPPIRQILEVSGLDRIVTVITDPVLIPGSNGATGSAIPT